MRLLVTGCTGFLGRSIGQLAARNDYEVLGIGRSNQPPAGWPGKYLQKDVAHSDISMSMQEFMPDVLFHAAGPASVSLSFAAPLDDLQAAILTWANTLDSVRRSNLNPLVLFPSSAAVYGNPTKLPVCEDAVIAPISPYGFHKAACELLAREYSKCFDLDIIVCRFFSVFGVGQRRLLIWELYQQLVGPDSTVWLHGTGTESRDYLDVDDIGVALLQLVDHRFRMRKKSPYKGRHLVVNVASGEETKVHDLALQIRNLVAPAKTIRCRGMKRPGDPARWGADISLLRSLVPSWEPKPFSLALSQCVATWQKQRAFSFYEAEKDSL